LTLSGILIRRRLFESAQLSADYMRYSCDAAVFPSVSGDERRDIVDLRFSGAANGFDWDLEAMNQTGRIGVQIIEAWAVGALAGYTFPDVGWTPRLALSIDVASGDRNPHDDKLETFNPLFPNGYYLADDTGYPNLIHVKPTVRSIRSALLISWPPSPGSGARRRRTRSTASPVFLSSERREDLADAIRNPIREAGGHDSNYLGVELTYGW
jgi:hypothetical protein